MAPLSRLPIFLAFAALCLRQTGTAVPVDYSNGNAQKVEHPLAISATPTAVDNSTATGTSTGTGTAETLGSFEAFYPVGGGPSITNVPISEKDLLSAVPGAAQTAILGSAEAALSEALATLEVAQAELTGAPAPTSPVPETVPAADPASLPASVPAADPASVPAADPLSVLTQESVPPTDAIPTEIVPPTTADPLSVLTQEGVPATDAVPTEIVPPTTTDPLSVSTQESVPPTDAVPTEIVPPTTTDPLNVVSTPEISLPTDAVPTEIVPPTTTDPLNVVSTPEISLPIASEVASPTETPSTPPTEIVIVEEPKTINVTIGDGATRFTPAYIKANPGDTILFNWVGKNNHSVTETEVLGSCNKSLAEGAFDSGVQMPGTKWSLKLPSNARGLKFFYCKVAKHCVEGAMSGTIIVPE